MTAGRSGDDGEARKDRDDAKHGGDAAPDLRIGPWGDRPLGPILDLLDASFAHLSDDDEAERRRRFVRAAAEEGTLLAAESGETVAGFRAFGRADRHPEVLASIQRTLYFARNPELEPVLRSALQADADRWGLEETVVEYFESSFSDPAYRMGARPYFGSSLVVRPGFRRMGLGARLNEVGMEHIGASGGTEFFAYVITPSPAEAIGIAQEVPRVLRVGPVTEAGGCRLLFGRRYGS